jgi:hypothetical protein
MKSKQQGYGKLTNFFMLSALLTAPMVDNLRLIQKDELKVLDKKHTNNIVLSPTERNYLQTLYQNFVLNNFKFDDKIKKLSKNKVKKQKSKPKHIGMRLLHSL